MSFLQEFWSFLSVRKKRWWLPLLILVLPLVMLGLFARRLFQPPGQAAAPARTYTAAARTGVTGVGRAIVKAHAALRSITKF